MSRLNGRVQRLERGSGAGSIDKAGRQYRELLDSMSDHELAIICHHENLGVEALNEADREALRRYERQAEPLLVRLLAGCSEEQANRRLEEVHHGFPEARRAGAQRALRRLENEDDREERR